MPSSSPEINTRSRTKDIKRRKPIHDENTEESEEKEKSPFTVSSRGYSKSPKRNEKLYPDLMEELCGEEILESDPLDNNSSKNKENCEESVKCGTSEDTKGNYILSIVAAVIIVIIAMFFVLSNSSKKVIDCSQFSKLHEKYPQQNKKIFQSLKVSTEGLYNREPIRPSVFAFFSTDQSILDIFTEDILEITKNCTNQQRDPINLKNSDLNKEEFIKDHTKIISEYKKELVKSTIMIINNLDGLSTDVLPALHSFADTYNPLVQKSILYFTIKVPERPQGKDIDYIFDHLKQKWKKLSDNVREPLITRILDQTYFLKPYD